jgi:hypothetical protein
MSAFGSWQKFAPGGGLKGLFFSGLAFRGQYGFVVMDAEHSSD